MVYPGHRSTPKAPPLHPTEWAALRDVANNRVVETLMLNRLKELGLVEQKRGGWTTTQQGKIRLLFGGAR